MPTLREMIDTIDNYNRLVEYVDPEKTAGKIGDQLRQKFTRDNTIDNNTDVTLFIREIAEKVDPTDNHQYTLWILRLYYKNGIRRFEDMGRVNAALGIFHQYKKQFEIKDINQYKQLSDLEAAAEKVEIVDSENEKKRQYSQEMRENSEIIYEGPEGMIVSPKTQEASCYWGRGTRWCTAATGSYNLFDSYSENLIIVLPKDGTKWQFHEESNQYMDSSDEPINISQFKEDYPWAVEILKDHMDESVFVSAYEIYVKYKDTDMDYVISEVSNIERSKHNIPGVEEYEHDRVVLETWSSFKTFINYEVPSWSEYFDDENLSSVGDMDISDKLNNLILSKFNSRQLETLERTFATRKEDVIKEIFDLPIDDLESKFPSIYSLVINGKVSESKETPIIDPSEYKEAFVLIWRETLSNYHMSAEYNKEDDTVGLYMAWDDFCYTLDANEDDDYMFYGQYWTDQREVFDYVLKDAENDYWADDSVKLLNSLKNQGHKRNVYLDIDQDTETADLFPNSTKFPSSKNVMYVSRQDIDKIVEEIKDEMNIRESIKKLAGMK